MNTDADKAALVSSALAVGNAEDGGGKADSSVIETSARLAQGDEAELAGMSFKDIEKAYGMDVPDRTDSDPSMTGDAPTHEIDRRIEMGQATAATEEALAAAAVQAMQVQPDPAAAAATAAKAAATTTAVVDPAATAVVEQVIETRDGKGKIPFSVLEAARQRIATVEAENAELRGKKQAEIEDAAIAGALSDEEIEALRNEFPDTVVNAIEKLNKDNIQLKRHNLELQRGAAVPTDDPAKLVQDIIDQDKVLSTWQGEALNGNTANWDRATAFDDMLRKDPEWAKKSIGERFDQVRALMGHPRVEEPVKTAAQIAQEAATAAEKAALAAAGATSRPLTHSDLPGGDPAAQTQQSQAAQLTTIQLEKMFEGKSPAQIDALLTQLG